MLSVCSPPLFVSALVLLFSHLILCGAQSLYPSTFPIDSSPFCSNSRYLSCGWPFRLNVTGAVDSTYNGPLGYGPFLFSGAIRQSGVVNRRVLLPNSLDNNDYACRPFTRTVSDDGTPFADNIVLILRGGGCFTAPKLINSDFFNAALVIMVHDSPTYRNQFNQPPSPVGVSAGSYKVSMITLTLNDGMVLYNYLKSGGIFNISIPGAGRVSPTTRAALAQMATSFTFNDIAIPVYGTIRKWTVAEINDLSKDPCWDRVIGLWCEDGEVVGLFLPFTGLIGTFNDGISALSNLRYIDLETTSYQGDMLPVSACSSLPNLFFLWYAATLVNQIPSCVAQLSNLRVLSAPSSRVAQFPTSILSTASRSLLYVDLRSNGMTLPSGMVSLPSMVNQTLPSLQYFDISGNQLIGSVPSFSGLANLTTIRLNVNGFDSLTSPMGFDALPSLQQISLSSNRIQSMLPEFAGSVGVQTIDLSRNSFTGGIPSSWSRLRALTTLTLSYNQLTTPIGAVGSLPSLISIDLSHNRLSVPGVVDITNNVGSITLGATALSVQVADFSWNQLQGIFPIGYMSIRPNLRRYFLSHNNITQIPPDLFSGSITHVDFSYNQLSSSARLPDNPAAPPQSISLIDFSNNPSFRGSLPTWLTINLGTQTKDASTNFFCGTLYSPTYSGLSIFLDPSYYSYQSCTCDFGFFGSVPNCRVIPTTNSASSQTPVLNPLAPISPSSQFPVQTTVFPYSFSDSWYGNKRTLPGIETVFTIDLRSSSILSDDALDSISFAARSSGVGSIPRTILLDFYLDGNVFVGAEESLTVYTGGSALLGDRVSVIRGDQIQSLPQIVKNSTQFNRIRSDIRSVIYSFSSIIWVRVPVIAQQASVAFSSRSTSGNHFTASYSASSNCPAGYKNSLIPDQCEKILPEYQVSAGLRYAIFALSAISVFATLCVMLYILRHSSTALVRASSRNFTFLMLVFIGFMGGTSSLYAIVPSEGGSICKARVWCSSVSLMGVLSILVAKSFRVSIIFQSKILLQIKNVSDFHVASLVSAGLASQIVMLVVFDAMNMSWGKLVSNGNDEVVWACDTGNGFDPWLAVQIALFSSVMIAGALVAFKTRSVPSAFNESTFILLSLEILLLFLILLVPINWALLKNSPDAAVVIQGGGQFVLAAFLLLINFLPKLYYISSGRGNDKSLIFSSQGTKMQLSSSQADSASGTSSVSMSSTAPSQSTSLAEHNRV